MRDFSKISPEVWRSKRFLSLASSDARLAHLYFLTNDHQNSIGCYRLPDKYAAADLGWDVERYVVARDLVLEAGLVDYDKETEELLVLGWLKHNPPMNPKHATGSSSKMGKIQSERLRDKLLEAWVTYSPKETDNNGVTKIPLSSQLQGSRMLSGNYR